MIEEVTADVRAGNIPFTEENLITIQDVFGMTVKAKYEVEIIKKAKCLLANFYEEVRRVDNKERMMQEQAEEDRSDMSTQFPENEEVGKYFNNKIENMAEKKLVDFNLDKTCFLIIGSRKFKILKADLAV